MRDLKRLVASAVTAVQKQQARDADNLKRGGKK
jgi:hypothetical protein